MIGIVFKIIYKKWNMKNCEFTDQQQKSSINHVEIKSHKKNDFFGSFFNQFSTKVTKITGGAHAFLVALVIVIIWATTGPVFHYSDTWQLVINTGTTIVTFLMVFIIQHSQNKDTKAVQLKLDELIAASNASNKLISVENLSEEELERFNEFYSKVSSDAHNGKSEKIISIEDIKDYEHDAIVITSYTFEDDIRKRLEEINYPGDKIERFFSE